MQVRETTIRELLSGQRQFRVPIFQRCYSWTTDELGQLWSDVVEQYEELRRDAVASSHFLGSFVLMPEAAPFSRPVPTAVIVDGQQRLLSIMVLLLAIRDRLAKTDETAMERYTELYFVNRWQPEESYLRVVPTPADTPAFNALINGQKADGHVLADVRDYFAGQLEAGDGTGQSIDLERLTRAAVERLSIVDITTDVDDNPFRIFESINATGRSLTQGDLLRNYVFMRLPTTGQHVYDDVWRPMEDLVGADRLADLARVDLQCRGLDVAVDDVYRQQRTRFATATSEPAVAAEVGALAKRARRYHETVVPSEAPPPLVEVLTRLNRWGATSARSLQVQLLEAHRDRSTPAASVALAIECIESYLVRRFIVGLPTSGLTRLFVQVGQQVAAVTDVAAAVQVALSSSPAYWPTDGEVREAVLTRRFYTTGRAPQRRFVLDRLEASYGQPEPVDLAHAALSIEHILPQSLSPEWVAHLTSLGDDPEEAHPTLVHTLGNLTLTAFNGSLSNRPMERKAQIYSESNLALNEGLKAATTWGSLQIQARGRELAERVIAVWEGPLPLRRPSSGYVSPAYWRPLEALLARLPKGGWATHQDVAAAVGTTETWVGRHLRNVPGLTGSHRAIRGGAIEGVSEHQAVLLRAEGTLSLDGTLGPERRLDQTALEALRILDRA